MAAELNITVEQGASWTRVCALQNAGATAYDLTGCTIEAQARGEFNLGATPEAQFVVTYAASRATGLFRLSLSWETTADQSFRKIMYWDILLTDADGTKIRLIEGGVEVTAATTIPDDETAEPTPATPSGSDTVDITIVLTSPVSATVGTAIVTDPTAIHYPSGSASMTTARLIGRYTTGSGLAQEITVGSGLVLNSSTGVLTASGGGGSGDITAAGDNVYLVGGSNAFASATNSFGSLNLDATASTLYGPDGLGLYASGGITYISGGGGALLDLTSSAFTGAWSADQWSVVNSGASTPPKLTLDQGQTAKGRLTLNRTSSDAGWQGMSFTLNRDYAADHTPSYDTNAQAATALTLEHSYTDRGGAGTFDTGTDVFTLATGTPPANYSAVLVTATTTMPTVGGVPLVAGTPYYVLAATGGAGGNFKIASSRALAIAGTALNIDGAGSGVSVSYDLQEVNLTYANSYSGEQRMFNIVAPSAAPKDGTIGMYAPFEVAIPSDHTGLALNGRVGVFSGYQNADQVKFVLSNLHATAGGTRLTMSSRSQDWHLDTDIGNNGGNNLGIYGAGGWRFYISSGGDIGIGNTAPSTKLDVTGTVTATLFSGSGASLTSVNAATVTAADDLTDDSHYVLFADGATGSQAVKTNTGLRFNPVSNVVLIDGDQVAVLPDITGGSRAASFTTGAFSGLGSFTANGAASTPALRATGVPFAGTGTTSFPLVYINDANATASSTLNTAGTYFGVNGYGTQDLMNLLKGGVSQFKVSSAGAATVSGGLITTLASGGNHLAFRTSDAPSTDKWINYVSGTSLAWYAASQDRLTLGSGGQLGVPGTLAVTGNQTNAGALITTPEALAPALNAGITVSVTTVATGFALNGANAATLANGTNGQIKTLACTAVTAAGTATLTPTTANGFSTVAFTAAGQTLTLQYFSTGGWVILSVRGATPA